MYEDSPKNTGSLNHYNWIDKMLETLYFCIVTT